MYYNLAHLDFLVSEAIELENTSDELRMMRNCNVYAIMGWVETCEPATINQSSLFYVIAT